MILEVADICIKEGMQAEFEKAVQVALDTIRALPRTLSRIQVVACGALWSVYRELPDHQRKVGGQCLPHGHPRVLPPGAPVPRLLSTVLDMTL